MNGDQLAVDHILLAVDDLQAGHEWLARTHGFQSLPGGRHPKVGTANRIVPLGDAYLELIAIVDAAEAAFSPLSARVSDALAAGRRLAAWAARTDDLDRARALRHSAGFATEGPFEGSRRREDGTWLRWRTLFARGRPAGYPFLIEWAIPEDAHPGRMGPAAGRLQGLVVSDPEPARLREWLGPGLPVEVAPGNASALVAARTDRAEIQ